jgi:2,4-dienoyl-CoA reductase-like NADH-dependent reductase (Old Yellow Enzyme family)
MGRHEQFRFAGGKELLENARTLGLDLPWSEDLAILRTPISVSGRRLPNRLAIHPLEGADADEKGGPGALTFRRYERFGAGGCGLIWFEAAAVTPGGRSNPRQLLLSAKNADGFKRLVDRTRAAARSVGPGHEPLLILQITHSGRFARPAGKPEPLVAHHVPMLDGLVGLQADHPVVEDETLDRLQDDFASAAALAEAAGFDGLDVKACHGYLVSELLGAHTRTGRYGGSFDNRTRFLRETAQRIKERHPRLIAAVRLNAFDALPHPFGFGAAPADPTKENLTESQALLQRLADIGASLFNVTAGIPHFRPHFGRPFNTPVRGGDLPDEHPLEGIVRLIRLAGELQGAVPSLPIVGTGYSWLRQFAPQVAAGVLGRSWAALIGFGRMAFAYPDFALDLLRLGRLDPRKVCLACSGCSDLPRAGLPAGCVVRDRPVYRPRGQTI